MLFRREEGYYHTISPARCAAPVGEWDFSERFNVVLTVLSGLT